MAPRLVLLLFFSHALVASFASAASPPECSIRDFATCSTDVDQRDGVAAAFAAAAAFNCTLVIDCVVLVSIGLDIAKPIYVESGTRVLFRGGGSLWLANQLLPAFMFVNVHDIELLDWDVRYVGTNWYPLLDGTHTISGNIGYYIMNGTTVTVPGGDTNPMHSPVGGNYNDITLRAHYESKHNVSFSAGGNPLWAGLCAISSTFQLVGDTHRVRFDGFSLTAASARAVDFVLCAFSLRAGWTDNQNVTGSTVPSNLTAAIPHHLAFNNVAFDGVYMAICCSVRDSVFSNVTSLRYSDLQDPDGSAATMGGCMLPATGPNGTACWLPPPHLFYINQPDPRVTDPALLNANVTISDVMDYGIRTGSNHHRILTSGNCLSIKFGASNSTVQRYTSKRRDGLIDVLYDDNVTYTNITAEYNSSFLNDDGAIPFLGWPAWRFTEPYYRNVRFANVLITDISTDETFAPMHGNCVEGINCGPGQVNSSGISFTNFTIVAPRFFDGIDGNASVVGQEPGSLRTYRSAATGEELTIDANNARNHSGGA